jgi:hypothetical protein
VLACHVWNTSGNSQVTPPPLARLRRLRLAIYGMSRRRPRRKASARSDVCRSRAARHWHTDSSAPAHVPACSCNASGVVQSLALSPPGCAHLCSGRRDGPGLNLLDKRWSSILQQYTSKVAMYDTDSSCARAASHAISLSTLWLSAAPTDNLVVAVCRLLHTGGPHTPG